MANSDLGQFGPWSIQTSTTGQFGPHKNEVRIDQCFFETRIDVYETLCPQQMLVHKGGKIKNWGGECRDVTPTKSLSQNIRVDVNKEVKYFFFGGGDDVQGGGGGHRVDLNKEFKFL